MIKIGKYGEALGLWELRVGGFDKNLTPQKGDNLKVMKLMGEAKKRNDETWMMGQLGELIKELIARDHPPLNEEEKKELDEYVEFNIVELMKELLITFRWTTKEQMEKLGDVDLKKLVPPG